MPDTNEDKNVFATLGGIEQIFRSGRAPEALDALKKANRLPADADFQDFWTARRAILEARVKLHMWDHIGAELCLGLVPSKLLKYNPDMDAELHTIRGMVLRRQAHIYWKRHENIRARHVIDEAIEKFSRAVVLAGMAQNDRLKYGAVLNEQYATGLLLQIEPRLENDRIALFLAAVIAEWKCRDGTPPQEKNNLTGLTIVVDLARGAGISAQQTWEASEDVEYRAACLSLFGGDRESWSKIILSSVKEERSGRPEIVAAALALGGEMLDPSSTSSDFYSEYATYVQYCYLDLQKSSKNSESMRRLERCLSRIPKEIVWRVSRPGYWR